MTSLLAVPPPTHSGPPSGGVLVMVAIAAVVFVIVGIVDLWRPEWFYRAQNRLYTESTRRRPSELGLAMVRFRGVVLVVGGIVMIGMVAAV